MNRMSRKFPVGLSDNTEVFFYQIIPKHWLLKIKFNGEFNKGLEIAHFYFMTVRAAIHQAGTLHWGKSSLSFLPFLIDPRLEKRHCPHFTQVNGWIYISYVSSLKVCILKHHYWQLILRVSRLRTEVGEKQNHSHRLLIYVLVYRLSIIYSQ